jgi:hypothetical protein
MPRLATFDGIAIFMYAADHNPPHVHAYYGDHEALLAIRGGAVLVDSLPSKQRRAVVAWIVAREGELVAMWDELNG